MTGCPVSEKRAKRATRDEQRQSERSRKETQGQTYHKAQGKPRMRLDDAAAVVAAVVAAADHALVALDFLAERVLAAREDDAHGGGGRQ